jgi:hypothetical protein
VHDTHPVALVVQDDLKRSRPTVFFRLLLALPHYVWFALWSILVVPTAVVAWIAVLASGRLPAALHRFFAAYLRYTVHLTAYLTLVANPYPTFSGGSGSYPLDVAVPEPVTQPRTAVLVRLLLALPALFLASILGGGGSVLGRTKSVSGSSTTTTLSYGGLSTTTAVLGWFASIATGEMPRGLRDAGAYATGYRAQSLAYLLLLTPVYPNADPTAMLAALPRPPQHPVRIVGDASALQRSRATVFFRLILALPHLLWLTLWGIASFVVAIVQWCITLSYGRPAVGLHRFLSRYVRYSVHVNAYLFLVADPFPSFNGEAGYPLDVELPPPGRQGRWKTGLRIIVALPALWMNSALQTLLVGAAVLSWFASLATGAAPEGLRNASAYAVRYGAQTNAYVLLLTDVYPYASPLEGAAVSDEIGSDSPAAPPEASALAST